MEYKDQYRKQAIKYKNINEEQDSQGINSKFFAPKQKQRGDYEQRDQVFT